MSVLTTAKSEGVLVLTLNRPDQRNALNMQLRSELASAIADAALDDDVRVVVLTGAGDRAFCAGLDVKERGDPLPPAQFFAEHAETIAFHHALEAFPKPLIAAINGVAAGGGLELALCCDIRIAADSARMGLPEAKLGAIPTGGGPQRLLRLVGPSITKELLFTTELIDAQRALSIGLVNRVVASVSLASEVTMLAKSIAVQAPLAVRMAKYVVDTGAQGDAHSAIELERLAAAMLSGTEDRREGFRAFVEKRAPKFRGH